MTLRRAERWPDAAGMTLIELCVVILIMGILMTLGTAALLRARIAGHESNAISALRTINSASIAYAADCGNGHFTYSLTRLAASPRGGVQGYLAADLGSADTITRNGYVITLEESASAATTAADCHGEDTRTGYYAAAVPTEHGSSGNRSFATDQNRAIWQVNGPSAPTQPFGAPATMLVQ
jgi:prepilin-type N-terminal cleavage/methylation domain-containing protein